MEPCIYITYDMLFKDEPLNIAYYLESLDRLPAIDFALGLLYNGNNSKITLNEYIELFLSKHNREFAEYITINYNKVLYRDIKSPTGVIPRSYFLVSESTAQELLRVMFSIREYKNDVPIVIQEQNLLKAIVLINQSISHWNIDNEINSTGDFTDLYYAKSFFCSFLKNYERTKAHPVFTAVLQIIKGYHFFEFCENTKLSVHLSRFLENNGVNTWQEYLYNVIRLILFPLQEQNGKYPIITLNGDRDGYTFLHSHSFNINETISLEKNHDYTFFKAHPIIEVDERRFIPISSIFCINHLYRSVYFELREINQSYSNTENFIKGLLPFITTKFSEQNLFRRYIQNTLIRQNGIKLSDEDCSKINKSNHEPDFYFRNGNNIFLFENKDIKIADYIINSYDYKYIEEALNKKVINDAGLSQLAYNIQAIDQRTFPWDKNIPNNPKIYPVLVLADSTLSVHGFNYILNDALESQIKKMNLKTKVHPLVVIELDTLIAFADSFKSGKIKLKDVIDKYFIYQKRYRKRVAPKDILEEVYHKYYPFYTFVSQQIIGEPTDYDTFNKICDDLKQSVGE